MAWQGHPCGLAGTSMKGSGEDQMEGEGVFEFATGEIYRGLCQWTLKVMGRQHMDPGWKPHLSHGFFA